MFLFDPILEFSSVIWNPLLKQGVVKVESVQRRFTKRLKGLHNLPYTTRLSNLGVTVCTVVVLKLIYLRATKLLIIMHALSLPPLFMVALCNRADHYIFAM